jgi:hypothetical protein
VAWHGRPAHEDRRGRPILRDRRDACPTWEPESCLSCWLSAISVEALSFPSDRGSVRARARVDDEREHGEPPNRYPLPSTLHRLSTPTIHLPRDTLHKPPVSLVELRAARIPWIGWFAWHHWFVIVRPDARDRWEVWQSARAGGDSWGHLHRNLLPPDRGVGAGSSWVVQSWRESAAAELAQRIERSPAEYPFRERYHYWPGPNSNTYVQWVLGCRCRLSWHACGRGFISRQALSAAIPLNPPASRSGASPPPFPMLPVRKAARQSLNP